MGLDHLLEISTVGLVKRHPEPDAAGRGAERQLPHGSERAQQARPRLRDRRRVPRGTLRDERDQQVQDAVEGGKSRGKEGRARIPELLTIVDQVD